jgi:hypothetical protein
MPFRTVCQRGHRSLGSRISGRICASLFTGLIVVCGLHRPVGRVGAADDNVAMGAFFARFQKNVLNRR